MRLGVSQTHLRFTSTYLLNREGASKTLFMRLACIEHYRKQNIFCLKVPHEVNRTIGGKYNARGMEYVYYNFKIVTSNISYLIDEDVNNI